MSRTDIASRLVEAEAGRVYDALVDPDALTVWLPPTGMSARFERFELRPGGGYRLVLGYDDPAAATGKSTDGSDIVEARFLDLLLGTRVRQAVEFVSEDPAFSGTMLMTWEVVAVDGGTLVTFRADDVPAGISADDHLAGMNASLANLASYLES